MTVSTIFLLLATVMANVYSCPLGSEAVDCQDECAAYRYAKDLNTPVYLSINATLSKLTNEGNTFRNSLSYDGGLYPSVRPISTNRSAPSACYAAHANKTVGCSQYFGIEEYGYDEHLLACPWKYQCDYDQNRIPQYLWIAHCNQTTSVTVNYPVPVLERESCNSLSPWTLVMKDVAVACTCKSWAIFFNFSFSTQ